MEADNGGLADGSGHDGHLLRDNGLFFLQLREAQGMIYRLLVEQSNGIAGSFDGTATNRRTLST